MAAKKKKKEYVGIISLDGQKKESEKFTDKSEAQKWVQREMSSDFVWVGDSYASVLQVFGEVKAA